jgi:hypothetical protein
VVPHVQLSTNSGFWFFINKIFFFALNSQFFIGLTAAQAVDPLPLYRNFTGQISKDHFKMLNKLFSSLCYFVKMFIAICRAESI